jgi:PDZ domain-containing protein/BON domain-containing protein
MGKNGGGEPTDAILTLEEALMRFKRKRGEVGEQPRVESVAEGNVHYVDFSATVEHEQKGKATTYLGSAFDDASVSAHYDDPDAGTPADEDLVAVIDGIPRTLADLERLAAAEKAYDQDFPAPTLESAEVEDDDDDLDAGAMDLMAHETNRHAMMRDYAFTAMGTALMVLVAVLVMHVPIVNNNNRPALMAQSIATPALKASSSVEDTDDLISSLVIVPDAQTQAAPEPPLVKAPELEARIKDTLKVRAFPDIGVSVSTKGDAYLAGEVYSLDEARKISNIVHNVNGVNRVHFLHPDVRPAGGPAFFGVATTSAPAVWGAKVKSVIIGSPADKAGIKPGDVISEFDGNTVPDAKYLDLLVTHYSPGQRVQFRVWHNGQPEYLVARLGEVTTVASR